MLHSPLLQLTKNRRHLGYFKLWFYYSTFITNNEVKNENRLSVFRSRQDTGREGTFILTFHITSSSRQQILHIRSRWRLTFPPLWRLTAFPHYGNRSFAAAQDDVLWSSSSRQQILHVRLGWRLTVSLTTATDSDSSSMHWMTSCRPSSFRTGIRMLCEKIGKQNGDAEWRIYYSDDILPFSSPQ